MLIGKFGSMTFEVSSRKIRTFYDFSLNAELETETGDAANKIKPTKVKGINPIKISLELLLQTVLGCNVQGEIDDWLSLKNAAAAYPFILCGRAVSLNKFLLTNCDVSDVKVTPVASRPTVTSASLKLQFLEYVPPGAQSGTVTRTKGKAGTKRAKGVSTENIRTANPYKIPTPAQKAAAKR